MLEIDHTSQVRNTDRVTGRRQGLNLDHIERDSEELGVETNSQGHLIRALLHVVCHVSINFAAFSSGIGARRAGREHP